MTMKRIFDIIFSSILLIVLSPILLIVIVAIKIETKGRAVFIQERVGLFGHPFLIYKFRSMVEGADREGEYFTCKNDLRITKVGSFIRKTSIDEIPQLFNVVRGDMSIVGPRPNVFKQESNYSKAQWEKRNSIQPGITGLAQAKIRSVSNPRERTKLDLEYIDTQSFVLDLKIIIMTIYQIIFKRDTN